MPRRRRRSAALLAGAAAVALALAGCSDGGATRLVEGSEVELAWYHELTSTNPASVAGATPGNRDVAAMTRGAFFTMDQNGELREDPSFGVATIVRDDPFTVRYDLADVSWSDGVPVDASDLVLAWAAASNARSTPDLDPDALRGPDGRLDLADDEAWFDVAEPGGMRHAAELPVRDDWARSIDVAFAQPVPDWRTALDVQVPAHVVGQRAFGVSDPMAAKQRVLDAIDRGDRLAIAAIAREWSTGFAVRPADLERSSLLSNAPYRFDRIVDGRIELVANSDYDGDQTAQVERVVLRGVPDSARALQALVGDTVDVATVRPTDDDRTAIRDLERAGATLSTAGDGMRWMLSLRADRAPLQPVEARQSLLRAIDRSGVLETVFGERASEARGVNAALFLPGTRLHEYATEDSGFTTTLGTPNVDESIALRDAMAIPAGTGVCLLYDRADAFAAAALPAIQASAAESGWAVQDCGTDDLAAGLESDAWNAVLRLEPVPLTVEQMDARWRGGGVSGVASDRVDALLTEALSTGAPDAVEGSLLELETALVQEAIVLPIAERPQLTVSLATVQGVRPRPGPAPLTWAIWEWGYEEQ